jgi:hypothetical protein
MGLPLPLFVELNVGKYSDIALVSGPDKEYCSVQVVVWNKSPQQKEIAE